MVDPSANPTARSPRPDSSTSEIATILDLQPQVASYPRWLWFAALVIGVALSFGVSQAARKDPRPDGQPLPTVLLSVGLGLTGASAAYLLGAQRRAPQIRRLIRTLSLESTKLREAEGSLALCQKQRLDVESRFRQLIESAPDIIVTLDMEGRITSCNPYGETVTGRTGGELTGKSLLSLMHPEDLQEAQHFFASALSGSQPPPVEIRLLNKSGEPASIEFRVLLQVEGSSVVGVLAIGQDLSARREAEQGQARWQSQLRRSQKMEAIGTLAGGIAHDFNNILTAIVSNAELARMQMVAVHPAAQRLDEIRQACSRAAGLVSQILAFSRQQDQERRCLSLESIVNEATKLLRSALPASVEIQTRFAADCPSVLANPGQMYQVLLNLGTNAAHAMREHGGKLEVAVSAVEVDAELAARISGLKAGRYVRLSVSDNGHGMSAATLARIFDPFFTTKAPGEGTGLGLAMVQGIVRSHDGNITVQSEPGKGTVFHLYFPTAQPDSTVAQLVSQTIPRGNGQRILFVDDESSILEAGRQILAHLEYEVVVCHDGVAALEWLKSKPGHFACVITDLSMPAMNGLELARECHGLYPGLPIILTTGYLGDLTNESVQARGILEVVEKPFSLHLLAATIHRALNHTPDPPAT